MGSTWYLAVLAQKKLSPDFSPSEVGISDLCLQVPKDLAY